MTLPSTNNVLVTSQSQSDQVGISTVLSSVAPTENSTAGQPMMLRLLLADGRTAIMPADNLEINTIQIAADGSFVPQSSSVEYSDKTPLISNFLSNTAPPVTAKTMKNECPDVTQQDCETPALPVHIITDEELAQAVHVSQSNAITDALSESDQAVEDSFQQTQPQLVQVHIQPPLLPPKLAQENVQPSAVRPATVVQQPEIVKLFTQPLQIQVQPHTVSTQSPNFQSHVIVSNPPVDMTLSVPETPVDITNEYSGVKQLQYVSRTDKNNGCVDINDILPDRGSKCVQPVEPQVCPDDAETDSNLVPLETVLDQLVNSSAEFDMNDSSSELLDKKIDNFSVGESALNMLNPPHPTGNMSP